MFSNSECFSNFTVITYNIQQLLFSYSPRERAEKLLAYLQRKNDETNGGIDVIVLEEAFLPSFLDYLKTSFFSSQYHIIPPRGILFLNSGVCCLLKKAKFKEENYKVIQEMYSFGIGFEQFESKGFVHIKALDEENKKCHIIGTHTQSQTEGSNQQIIVTFAQLAQLRRYIFDKIPSGEPIIFMGDLNILTPENNPIVDPILLKYLFYPLIKHPSQSSSYNPEKNYLSKKQDPKGEVGTFDYIFSRVYKENDSQVLTDTTYTSRGNPMDISDHYPVKGMLRCLEELPVDTLNIEEQQKLILSKLLGAAFKETTQVNFIGQWKAAPAKKIYFALCRLITYYDALTKDNKVALGVGSDFLSHCLSYNEPTTFTSFCKASTEDESNYEPLSELIDYGSFKSHYFDLTLDILEQDGTFKNIQELLHKTKEFVNDVRFNKIGRNLFFKKTKCPSGIQSIRSYLNNIDSMNGTELIEKIPILQDLLIGKNAAAQQRNPCSYRNIETKNAYEILSAVFNGFMILFPDAHGKTETHNDTYFADLLSKLNSKNRESLMGQRECFESDEQLSSPQSAY